MTRKHFQAIAATLKDIGVSEDDIVIEEFF